MKAHYLGHVVFYVKNLERSPAFYRDLLEFQEFGGVFNGAAAALTSGQAHHELVLIQVGNRSTSRSSGYTPIRRCR
jgi:catechol 2,3-dioxygenase